MDDGVLLSHPKHRRRLVQPQFDELRRIQEDCLLSTLVLVDEDY